jgi:hypothetical protein
MRKITPAIGTGKPRAIKVMVALLLCLPFTGCYTSNGEVITSQAAEAMPYTATTVDLQADGKLELTHKPGGNDYAFRHTKSDDPTGRAGTIRGIHIKGNIYAVQMKYDDESSYDIAFCRLHAGSFELVVPKSDSAVKALAAQDKVAFTGLLGALTGDPADVLKFIRDHKQIEFKKFKD